MFLFGHPVGLNLETASDRAERLDVSIGELHVVARNGQKSASRPPQPRRGLAAVAIDEETQTFLERADLHQDPE